MVFTIEPMVNQGTAKIKTKKDGWTVVTRDKKLSAQSEHTIVVTSSGYEVLILRNEESCHYQRNNISLVCRKILYNHLVISTRWA